MSFYYFPVRFPFDAPRPQSLYGRMDGRTDTCSHGDVITKVSRLMGYQNLLEKASRRRAFGARALRYH